MAKRRHDKIVVMVASDEGQWEDMWVSQSGRDGARKWIKEHGEANHLYRIVGVKEQVLRKAETITKVSLVAGDEVTND